MPKYHTYTLVQFDIYRGDGITDHFCTNIRTSLYVKGSSSLATIMLQIMPLARDEITKTYQMTLHILYISTEF